MPLRIVIDARRVSDFGIGTYIRNLVRTLATLDSVNHYTLIVSSPQVSELAGAGPNFEMVIYPRTTRTGMAQIGFGYFLHGLRADVYHIPLNLVPLWMPKPYLVTTHDMSSLLFGAQSGFRNNVRRFFLRRGLLRADQIIAVSGATRRDVEAVLGVPASRIRVVYNAPDPVFRPRTETGVRLRQAPEVQRVLERYRIQYPYVLYVGRTNPEKNIPRLVEAFAVLLGELQDDELYRHLRLIIIGDAISKHPVLRHTVIHSRVESSVRFLGFVPIETLRAFYQAAAAFVFPSLYEGFGLPPLEAMACGTPVVCSNVSALPEVVGDAAMKVNPENVFDIARGIREVLLDETLRARLIDAGSKQVAQFSWAQTARQVLQAYQEIAATRNRPA